MRSIKSERFDWDCSKLDREDRFESMSDEEREYEDQRFMEKLQAKQEKNPPQTETERIAELCHNITVLKKIYPNDTQAIALIDQYRIELILLGITYEDHLYYNKGE